MPIRPDDFDLAPDPTALLLHPNYSGAAALVPRGQLAAPVLEQHESIAQAGLVAGNGDIQGAIRLLEAVLRSQPYNATVWFSLAWYYAKQKNFRKSTNCYRKGLELDAGNAVAWNNLGHDLRHLRRLRESEEALRRSLAIDPTYPTAWTNLGITLQGRRRFSDASIAFTEALNLKPDDGSCWYWLAQCRAQCQDHNAAITAFRKATELNSQDWDAWSGLGDSLKRMGYAQEAREAYARATGFVPAPNPLGWIELFAAIILLAASFAIELNPAFGLAAVIAFAALLWRLRLTRVQLFVVLVAALPMLAVQFAGSPLAAEICAGTLLVWTAAVGRLWRRLRF